MTMALYCTGTKCHFYIRCSSVIEESDLSLWTDVCWISDVCLQVKVHVQANKPRPEEKLVKMDRPIV